ncbi:kinesin-like protein KIN-7C [Phragmites australis]|uniref:kinesin-like protein KIN-7C n=1 Tax=Phragmites australis TaxID=29695 RepID=UPI002D79B3FE|nr:kinesin-like protein KIN-7C [Phragmites australis]XP_062222617.1 kinesin-like protein KIN-7C [Phragmites australis]
MGAVGGDQLVQWDKMGGPDAVNDIGGGAGKLDRIQVLVRLRPLSEKEVARGEPAEWECINDTTVMFRSTFPDRPTAPTAYTFDRVFHSDCSTKEVYVEGVKEVALSVVSGINSSIFAYGQTSSGKTYTMTGVTEYTVADIYDYINKHEERAFVLKFSAIEIYNEVVRDLLSAENTPLRLWDDAERGTYVENLTEVILRDWNHLKGLISVCEAQRRTGETFLNEKSSRSHQILRLTVESSAREFLGKDKSTTLVASANFIDLAGSERASQALSAGTRLKEGCHINKSLLALGTVIRKLSMGSNAHIPYRDSKLTRILQPSLGGNARTAIICTLSPATSHIEQSRNTLLFGSCAKEVVTSAQVNVVMSDKALVKHLQKEVARLESELRQPASNSSLEALVKEKDNQIRKMEKEIKELKSQRDLAQSRLQNLLQTVGEHPKHSGSGKRAVRSPPSIGMPPCNSRDDSSQISHDESDIYKEVRCIETNGTGGNEQLDISAGGSSACGAGSNASVNSRHSRLLGETPITLEQHLENIRRPFVCGTRDLGSSTRNSSGCRVIGRSRSCRSLTGSTLFDGMEVDDGTPLNRSLVDFPGRSEGYNRRGSALNYDAESETLSRAGSILSETSKGATNTNGACDAEFTGIGEFVAELKEMAQVHYQKQLGGQNANGEYGDSTIKSIGLDPIVVGSPSRWPLEFEKKQQEIIELWHACSISLVHRTYFFLLFKGDQADSIYMEVELRRLSFLRETYSRGSTPSNAVVGSLNSSPVASAKKLQREREMLARQMQKQLTVEEREHLYTKWGVSLDSKKRKLQVARRLWTETKDLEHVRESASLVAKLIGLQEPGQVLREMFGLSFAPQQPPPARRRSSNGWRYGIPSFG